MDAPEHHFRFGLFQLCPETAELSKSGRRIALQEQPLRILVLLLERGGELVTRDELQKVLWPSVSYGDFDQGVNTAVKKLRQALGDSASNPRFVETVPRRGYRFIAPVSPAESLVATAGIPGARLEERFLPRLHAVTA